MLTSPIFYTCINHPLPGYFIFLFTTILIALESTVCFGAQKNRLIEMVLLSTHNICFG